jgi:hypothetical protein
LYDPAQKGLSAICVPIFVAIRLSHTLCNAVLHWVRAAISLLNLVGFPLKRRRMFLGSLRPGRLVDRRWTAPNGEQILVIKIIPEIGEGFGAKSMIL